MIMATRLADASLRVRNGAYGRPPAGWARRADYLYVLPAIVVMLIVIAYPIYYTIDLSFFNTPPSLQLRDKNFVGFDNYSPDPQQRRVLACHGQHLHLDHRSRPCSPSSWAWARRLL